MPTASLRPVLARDGVFNARDLGGTPVAGGGRVRPHLVVRADALHRCGLASSTGLRDHGVRLVLDLRGDSERDHEGVFDGAGISVEHVPVVDPAYDWDPDHMERDQVLVHRYREVLESFSDRFVDSMERIAAADGGVAYHCAVGKDRTGLLTALLLGVLDVPREVIVSDYARSARAVAVQVSWLWFCGSPAGHVDDDELVNGLWSAQPSTMAATLDYLERDHGGAENYLTASGMDRSVGAALRSRLVED